MIVEGIAGSKGIAIGKVLIYEKNKIQSSDEIINEDQIVAEVERLERAIALSKKQITAIKEKALKEIGREQAQIFDAHLLILEDPVMLEETKEIIAGGRRNAASAVEIVVDKYVSQFAKIDDPYLKERASDIKDVGDRIINNLSENFENPLADLKEEVIIVAHDLTPSDTTQLDKKYVLGFATEMGGQTSHTAILANSLGICAVLGLKNLTNILNNGDTIILDGFEGKVIINPDEAEIKRYTKVKQEYELFKEILSKVANLEARTTDGKRVEVAANIGSPNETKAVIKNGGEGVGLFRTEFLYLNRKNLPSEEEQFIAYKKAAEELKNNSVIIRTLDIGGDKQTECLHIQDEQNPFLGYRAIRLCLDQREVFKTQLRAILRSSAYGRVLIMFPMIVDIREVREAKGMVEEAKSELKSRGIKYDENIKVGIMIETPSAALTADIIAPEVDFFSIGTNDLCQYTLAVDRTNEKVSYLYQPFHPAVLRLIKHVIDVSHKHGIFTGICGEMAGDPLAVYLLVGLGIDELSMNPSSILQVKNMIRNISYSEAKEIASKAMEMTSAQEVYDYLNKVVKDLTERSIF